MNSIKVCEYSRSRSSHDDLILHDQASGERSQDQWSSGIYILLYYQSRIRFLIAHTGQPRYTVVLMLLVYNNIGHLKEYQQVS